MQKKKKEEERKEKKKESTGKIHNCGLPHMYQETDTDTIKAQIHLHYIS